MTMADQTVSSPYADAWQYYWDAGWRGVLPLPYRKKTWPPDGFTGHSGVDPSYADCMTWADAGPRNLALRVPSDVIGLDVDAYADKPGGETLSKLVSQYGPLPATWLSTSRGDGISGIRLYRVPAGTTLPTKLPGIELIQRHHRYVTAWPSVHPEGRVYQWVDEATGEIGCEVPPYERIPDLPAAWIEGLAIEAAAQEKADLTGDEAAAIFAGFPTGEPCGHIWTAAGKAATRGDRHDVYNETVLAVCRHARNGCPGGQETLLRLRAMFIAEVTADRSRTPSEAQAEWMRNLTGALALVAQTPQGAECAEDWSMYDIPVALEVSEPAQASEAESAPEADPLQSAIRRKAAELMVVEEARALLARRKASEAPPLGGERLTSFLAQPDEVIAYRVDRLWTANGRVLLAAAAKAGKTTMMTNLLGCLADGGAFLNTFDTQPVDPGRSIVYLNLEVSGNQMRRWLRRAGIRNTDAVHVVNLRGQLSALTLASEDGRTRVSGWLRDLGAQVVILDPLAPLLASLGLDENSNTDIATFFAWWSEALFEAGVADDIVCHHAGHYAGRSRGASRLMDEPDALWTITRDSAVDEDDDDIYAGHEPRFFKATGRDVEQPEQPLTFDPDTGLLELGSGNRKAMRQAAQEKAAKARVLAAIDAGNHTQRTIRTVGGNEKQNIQALEMLVEEGVLKRQIVGQAHHYSRVVPSGASTTLAPVAPVGGADLYRGTTTPVGEHHHACRACGTALEHAGVVYCPDCARRRTQGEDL